MKTYQIISPNYILLNIDIVALYDYVDTVTHTKEMLGNVEVPLEVECITLNSALIGSMMVFNIEN